MCIFEAGGMCRRCSSDRFVLWKGGGTRGENASPVTSPAPKGSEGPAAEVEFPSCRADQDSVWPEPPCC